MQTHNLENKIFEVLRNSSESDKKIYQEQYRLDQDIIITVDGLKCEITPLDLCNYRKGVQAYSYRYVKTIELNRELFKNILYSN